MLRFFKSLLRISNIFQLYKEILNTVKIYKGEPKVLRNIIFQTNLGRSLPFLKILPLSDHMENGNGMEESSRRAPIVVPKLSGGLEERFLERRLLKVLAPSLIYSDDS